MRDIVSPIDGIRSPFGRLSGLNPALSLDFLTGSLDSRITYSGASQKTMFDSTGKLTYAPNNLALQSNSFNDVAWNVKTNISITSGVSDPFGGTNAFTVTATSANGRLLQSVDTPNGILQPHIGSFWIRRRTGTGVVTWEGVNVGVGPTITLTSTWQRFSLKGEPASAIYYLGLRIDTSGDEIDIAFSQVERVTYETTPRTYNATTSAAYYGPRFDYNPATLAARGLLIEESRTNIAVRAQELDNASWTKDGATVTANATTAPDGTNTADKLVEDTAVFGGNHRAYVGLGTIPQAAHTVSIYAKADGRTKFHLRRAGGGDGEYILFDLAAVSMTDFTSGLATGTITSVGNGWYRCTVSTATIATTPFVLVCLHDDAGNRTYTGDGVKGIYFWGAQGEAGSFATSYIPTAAASVTRAADSASMTGTNFSSWYSAAEGTFVVEFAGPASGTRAALAVDDNTANEQMVVRTETTDPFFRVTDGGAAQAAIDAGTVAASTFYKLAVAYKVNNFAASLAGAAAVTDASGTIPTVDRLRIGADQGGNTLCGPIKTITYYKKRIPDATLQTLTT